MRVGQNFVLVAEVDANRKVTGKRCTGQIFMPSDVRLS